ncbi:hypothetical protein ROP_01900 [Rhodococcus opacus B4]|uniref:Uncharacterized protein n=1 Tax=Rhodococcus opacus (strain B4) TaxID=632772 RepID=C1ASI8_RHOOB|nr:hypothetical protein ROP_01900 [Rhodococcus opacus B4]
MPAGKLRLHGVAVLMPDEEPEPTNVVRSPSLHVRSNELMDQRDLLNRFLAEGRRYEIDGFFSDMSDLLGGRLRDAALKRGRLYRLMHGGRGLLLDQTGGLSVAGRTSGRPRGGICSVCYPGGSAPPTSEDGRVTFGPGIALPVIAPLYEGRRKTQAAGEGTRTPCSNTPPHRRARIVTGGRTNPANSCTCIPRGSRSRWCRGR